MSVLAQNQFGPIIFREEAVFRREVLFGDKLVITSKLIKAREDYSRWTIQHELWKNDDMLAAVLTLDGAWIDTAKRKLFVPPSFVKDAFDTLPKHADFYFEKPAK
jgi:acyl-CoA thioester hydrolase